MKNSTSILFLLLLTLALCTKQDSVQTLNPLSITLKTGNTYQIVMEENPLGKYNYSSGNELVADVDDNGMIMGKRVGETTIQVSGNGLYCEYKSTVIPRYNTFKEPITMYGISKDELKAKEERPFLYEKDNAMIFSGVSKEEYVVYLLEDEKLDFGIIILSSAHTDELNKYLEERYIIVTTYPLYAISLNNKTIIGTERQENSDWWVAYIQNSANKSASIKSQVDGLINQFKNEIIHAIK